MLTSTAPRPGLDWSRVTVRTVGFVPAVCDVISDVTMPPAGEYVELHVVYRPEPDRLELPPVAALELPAPTQLEPGATAAADVAAVITPIRGPGPKKRTAPGCQPGDRSKTFTRDHREKGVRRARAYPLAVGC